MDGQHGSVLSEKEFLKLDRFLLSENCPDTTMTMDSLHGFLTAIAIGPENIPQQDWLPLVWDSERDEQLARPKFANVCQEREIVALIERSLEEIKASFAHAPNDYQPLFGLFPWMGENLFDAEPWAWGFWLGVGLRLEAWDAIWKSTSAPLMRPFYLMGCEHLSEKENQLVSDPRKRHALAIELENNVVGIHSFWVSERTRMY